MVLQGSLMMFSWADSLTTGVRNKEKAAFQNTAFGSVISISPREVTCE